MDNRDAELQMLREKFLRKAKIEAMLKNLEIQLAGYREEESRLSKISAKEHADVDRLEGRSLAVLFYASMNRKGEKLDREKVEAYIAAVKHDTAAQQLRDAEAEDASLREEFADFDGVEEAYDQAFERKAEAIRRNDPEHAAALGRIEERLGFITAQEKEIDEAFVVGKTALTQIEVIARELDSAEGWGTWDLLGGGMLSDIEKHAHLDEAQERVGELQSTLRRYRTELSDVTVHADIQAQVEGFLRFADYFFDGLFADWAVLDSIHTSQGQLSSTRSQVETVQRRLEELRRAEAAETKGLEAERSDIVLGTREAP